MMRLVAGAVLIAALGGAATGCSSSAQAAPVGQAAPSGASQFTPAQPANPVPILRMTGVKVPAGTRLGDYDAFRNRMATGYFHAHGCTGYCGEQVTVYTTTDVQAALSEVVNGRPADGHAVITGKGFFVTVDGVEDLTTNSVIFYVKPAVIAQRVHGHLLEARS
jgi:hypothetical protein